MPWRLSKGRSIVDQIFTTRQILEKFWERNIDVPQLFIDFKAAYEAIWRKEIWSEMHKLGLPPKIAKLSRIINNEIYAKVKI
jgi:hypothetical protein